MGALHARIPPELAEQFEKLGEPVVVHRLTRLDDPAFCRAARDWLADRETARQVARHGRELVEDRRERRRMILLAAGLVIAWSAILSALLLQPAAPPPQEPLEAATRSQPATILEVE
jgi:hypothetical protein